MRAMRPAAPARLNTGNVIHTDQLPPVTIRPHFGSVSTASSRTLSQSASSSSARTRARAVPTPSRSMLYQMVGSNARGAIGAAAIASLRAKPNANVAPAIPTTKPRRDSVRISPWRWSLVIGGALAELVGSLFDGLADADIGHASAEVACHHGVDVLIARSREVLQEGRRLHDLPRLAVAALRNLKLDPGPLQWMPSFRIEPFDRRDVGVGDVTHGRDAGARRPPAHMHGAGAAHADAAAEFRPGEADNVADDPQQRRIVLDVDRHGAAVDAECGHGSTTPNGGLYCVALICPRTAATFASSSGQGG